MQSVTGARIRSLRSFLTSTLAQNVALIAVLLGISSAGRFILGLPNVSIVVILLLLGLPTPFVIWSGAFGTDLYVHHLARSKQPSDWDEWLC